MRRDFPTVFEVRRMLFPLAHSKLGGSPKHLPESFFLRRSSYTLRRSRYAEEGLTRGLYAGFSVNAVRSIGSAIVLAGYEAIQEKM